VGGRLLEAGDRHELATGVESPHPGLVAAEPDRAVVEVEHPSLGVGELGDQLAALPPHPVDLGAGDERPGGRAVGGDAVDGEAVEEPAAGVGEHQAEAGGDGEVAGRGGGVGRGHGARSVW
jgi:hypothetical protein